MVVTYRVNPVSAAVARRMITVPHVAMINLLAGRGLVPELLQDQCNPAQISAALADLLDNRAEADHQRQGFQTALAPLAPAGAALPSEAAARAVLESL
jgi:lipid-A-disaccharide synthase